MLFARFFPVVCLGVMAAVPLFGWGREGHRLIAALAWRHMDSGAQVKAADLLDSGESLESISAWADVVRPQRPETSTWHYINLPVSVGRGDWKTYCPAAGCVAQIIPQLLTRVKDPSLSRAERAEALKFLVHFVGDMHQPLHAGDKGDRGGNDVPVVFLNQPTNLHSLWDTALLEKALERRPLLRESLSARVPEEVRQEVAAGTLDDWLWEAHDAAGTVAYALLPEGRPAVLDERYVDAAAPCLELQIRRAGIRLARMLNQLLGE